MTKEQRTKIIEKFVEADVMDKELSELRDFYRAAKTEEYMSESDEYLEETYAEFKG